MKILAIPLIFSVLVGLVTHQAFATNELNITTVSNMIITGPDPKVTNEHDYKAGIHELLYITKLIMSF
jgi:hypothetical protein